MAKLPKLYNHLPYFLRVTGVNVYGYYLNWLRYGGNTQRLVEEALERETWSSQRWKAWQENRLAYILNRAATQVPFYREYWLQRHRHGDKASWEKLQNWPILEKETLRKNPRAFITQDCNPKKMFCARTSGTTGTPLTLWWSKETIRAWYALFEARVRIWNGLRRSDRWATLGGKLVVPQKQRKPPFWVWNAAVNQLYMSINHLSPANAPFYLEAIRRYKIKYIFGYASAMYSLAKITKEYNLEAPQVKVAISNAETFYQYQRDCIAKVFQCPARDTYGMVEVVCAASECSEGNMHIWPEVGIIEFMPDEEGKSPNIKQPRPFICTSLLNADMPLIRYNLGDCRILDLNKNDCKCGRGLPILQKIEGRLEDVILTRNGSYVSAAYMILDGLAIREGQIIQESLDCLRVRFVPAPGYTENDKEAIIQNVRERLGEMEIIFEPVDFIPRSANGKFRATISKVKV